MVNIIEKAELFLSENINLSSYYFKNKLEEEVANIKGLSKREKFLKLVALDLKIKQKKEEKQIILVRDKIVKVESRKSILEILDKLTITKELLYDAKKERKKHKALIKETKKDKKGKKDCNTKKLEKRKLKLEKTQANVTNEIEQKIINNQSVEEYELKDILSAFRNFIKNKDVLDNKETIIKYSKWLNDELIIYMYETNVILDEFKHLLDALKYKIQRSEKDSLERKILKMIHKDLRDTYQIYNVPEKEDKTEEAYFEIIDKWLKDETDYKYIRELVNRMPHVCNVRYNGRHIVFYILEKYIENFKKMIEDKNQEYINKDYLREIYNIFVRNYDTKLTKEEKLEVEIILKNFKNYINSKLEKRKRKEAALDEIKSMSLDKVHVIYNEEVELDDNEYNYERYVIEKSNSEYASTKTCIKAFTFANGKLAYSILKNEDQTTTIKVHTMAISHVINKKSRLSEYLKYCELSGKEVDDFLSHTTLFKKDKSYPTISYNLTLYPSGVIKEFDVSKEFIHVQNAYPTLIELDLDAQEFIKTYEFMAIKNELKPTDYDTYKINEDFKWIVEKEYLKFLNDHKLPFIYHGYSIPTEEEIDIKRQEIASYLDRLDKKEASEILNIINNRVDKMHYSCFPIKNALYDLDVVNPMSYLGVENERMLNDLYFNARRIESKDDLNKLKQRYLLTYVRDVDKFNHNLNYVDSSLMQATKGQLKRKVKI